MALEAVLALFGVQPALVIQDPQVGFANNVPLFVEQVGSDGDIRLATAANKRELFNFQTFPLHKPAGTYRIFCLGGSTTYGHPYDDRSSFAGWLRELLPRADGSRRWEVINAGGISYASYRVAALMEELARYQPDLFIIYTGHNEFLEERTYKDLKRLPQPLANVSAKLSRTRTYTALSNLVQSVRQASDQRYQLPAEVDARLDHSVGPADYHRDDVLRRQIVEHFEINLRRMIELAHASGANVLLVAPAANLKDCSPFKSEHRRDFGASQRELWNDRYRQGKLLQQSGEWSAAATSFRAAAEIDDRYADLHYRLGRCLLELGQFEPARQAFTRAADEDICPLRAPPEIVRAVRRAAQHYRTPLVDFEVTLRRQCQSEQGHAIPGNEYFLDHVHPTIDGNRRLAVAMVEELARRQLVQAEAGWRKAAEAKSAAAIKARLDPPAQGVAMRNVAKVLSWAGKIDEAGPAALRALEFLPDDRESLFIVGAYLKQTGRWSEGTDFYRRALELEVQQNDDDVEARQFLAAALAEQGQLESARQHYAEALRRRPESIVARRGLAGVLARQGLRAEARRHYQQALTLDPNDVLSQQGLQELDEMQ